MKPATFIRATCFSAAVFLFCTGLLFAKKPAVAEKKKEKQKEAAKVERPKFIQIREDEKGDPISLDTSIITYRNKKGVEVALVGALHIGEKTYYDELNTEFEKYDVVLYELVAKKGTRVPKGGGDRGGSPLSSLQKGMKSMLGLEFQLECVDYTKENLVHADLSPEEFTKSMNEKGESFAKMYFRMVGHGMAQQAKGQTSELDMIFALFTSNKEQRMYNLRRSMAGQFEDVESSMAAIEGEEGSTIIRARNEAALKVMKQQIKKGNKKIAIFYGAGHLPHMHDVLTDKFKMKVVANRWLASWNLRKPEEAKD